MRFIVYGLGAIGGVVAAALARSGQEVVGIARGTRLAAIRYHGLLLVGHDGEIRVPLDCVSAPQEISWRSDDAVLICVKGQQMQSALEALRAAGVMAQPIFCLQNGVENERLALRLFENVHGVAVMMPAEYIEDDEVLAFSKPTYGIFDIGRYPHGADAADHALADALTKANIAGFVTEQVMQSKYGKMLMNLHNIVEAALERGVGAPEITKALREEAIEVLDAAGIGWLDVSGDPRRDKLLQMAPLPGRDRLGGSSTQSLARGAGSIETDYFNGEFALLGRLHGCPAPLNARIAALAARLAREKVPPGSLTVEALKAELGM